MAKAKSKKELVEMSKAYFEAYSNEDTFYATSDGQFFTGKNKSAAVSHARTLKEEVTVIERSRELEDGSGKPVNGIELISKISGLPEEQVKEEWEKVKAEKGKKEVDTPSALQAPPPGEDEEGDAPNPAGLSPEGEEPTATAELVAEGDEKTAEGNGEVNEAIEAKADGTENVLEVTADAPDPAGLSPEGDAPEYSWKMERMADWMNEHDGDFDLKDKKPTLWKKVKAHYAKITGEG